MLLVGCSPAPKLPTVSVTFHDQADFVSPPFELEVVSDEASRHKGLMYRTSMPLDKGMLFIFPDERINSFWMKNTILSLDMLFLDKDLKIVGILERVPPQNEVSRSVDVPSQYVIELLAGATEKFRITKGMKASVKGALPTSFN